MASFYLDEPVADPQAGLLRQRGHDVITTTQANNKGNSDVQQLLYATCTGCILITYNRRDYTMLHEARHELAHAWNVVVETLHPGILLPPPPNRLGIADAARDVDALVGRQDIVNRLLIRKVPVGWTEETQVAG